MKLLLSLLSLVPPTLGFANFGCAGPCCLSDGSYLSHSETECVLSKGASIEGPCPPNWIDQGYQCVSQTQGTCCIEQYDGYTVQPDHSITEYCKINEVKNTPWYSTICQTTARKGATYGEYTLYGEYNHLGECEQDERKFIAAEQIPFC